jgi:hypothetical protein
MPLGKKAPRWAGGSGISAVGDAGGGGVRDVYGEDDELQARE